MNKYEQILNFQGLKSCKMFTAFGEKENPDTGQIALGAPNVDGTEEFYVCSFLIRLIKDLSLLNFIKNCSEVW